MSSRPTVLTCLAATAAAAAACLLPGCFEDPPMESDTSDSSGSTSAGMTSTTMPGTTTPGTTTASTGMEVTTGASMTTVGSLDTSTDDGTTTMTSDTEASESSGTTDSCVAVCSEIACGSKEACDCGMCSNDDATCADDQSYCALPIGFFNPFADQAQVFGNVQLGFRFEVFVPRTLRRLGAIAGGAGAEIRMAVYSDAGGPDARIAQTGAVMLYAMGNNEFDVGATELMPGDYWVMLHTNGPAPLRRTPNLDDNYEIAVRSPAPFMDGFPEVMNDESVIMDYRYNLYMVVED